VNGDVNGDVGRGCGMWDVGWRMGNGWSDKGVVRSRCSFAAMEI